MPAASGPGRHRGAADPRRRRRQAAGAARADRVSRSAATPPELQSKAEQQFAAHVITLTERDDIRKRVVELEKVVQAQGEVERLQARPPAPSPSALSRLVNAYEARTARLEEASARVRALAAWQFRLTGGAVVNNAGVYLLDWYGVAEVSFNLGAFAQSHHERRYLDARAEERKSAALRAPAHDSMIFGSSSWPPQRRRCRRRSRSSIERAPALASTLRALEGSDAPNLRPHAVGLYLDERYGPRRRRLSARPHPAAVAVGADVARARVTQVETGGVQGRRSWPETKRFPYGTPLAKRRAPEVNMAVILENGFDGIQAIGDRVGTEARREQAHASAGGACATVTLVAITGPRLLSASSPIRSSRP